MTDIMSHSQFHRINRLYLDMHGLIFMDYEDIDIMVLSVLVSM